MNEPTTTTDQQTALEQRVEPRDIRSVVAQAAAELVTAAFGGEVECTEGSLRLPHGVSIYWQPERRIINPDTIIDHGLMASFQLLNEGDGRSKIIAAQATSLEPPVVWHDDKTTTWTPDDGPQREWILSHLREEIAEYMPEPD